VADAVGDSYGLAKQAKESDATTILFSSVRFMAETAKIVNPDKTVLHPRPDAGCSLADNITAADVRRLRARHPGVPVMCYINTSAAVKAECDTSCTSANYIDIARALPGKELVFVPDRLMGMHLQKELAGEKTVHIFDATCEVHDRFTGESARAWREQSGAAGRRLVILAHPECAADVLAEADFVGSSEKMMDYARRLEGEDVDVMPVTECGTADRMRAEIPGLHVTGACVLCPHMKKTQLADILQVLEAPRPDQIIEIPDDVLKGAQRNLEMMFRLAEPPSPTRETGA
jgi:quinolinate synthase